MNNKLIVAALAAGIALPVAALPLFNLSVPQSGLGEVLQQRGEVVKRAPAADGRISKAPAKKVIASVNQDLEDITKYGELELCFEEDFSKLVKGSIDQPYEEEILHYYDGHPDFQYPWNNMYPHLTDVPGWGVGNAFSAGGCLYFPTWDGMAHVNTPIWDLTGEGGNIAVLEFKARAREGATYDYLYVEAAETHNWAPSWDINENVSISGINEEWATIRVIYQDCGPSFLFNICGVGPGEVYIDDIKVYKLKPYLHVPAATGHRNYEGSEFDLTWTASPGVDQYRLNVYDTETNGAVRDYLIEDRIVDGNSFHVTGAESGHTYYYTVAPVKDDIAALACRPCEVSDLEAPKMSAPELDGEWNFKAKWNVVPTAEVYDYFAYYERTAEQDGEFVLTDENFDGVAMADGTINDDWTKENVQNHIVDPGSYSTFYPSELRQQGWYGLHYTPFKDYIAVCGWWYGRNSWDNAGFISPELDLSKDGGKINISLDLAGEEVFFEMEDGSTVGYAETCAIALFNWNEEREDYDQVELFYVDRDENNQWKPAEERVGREWKHYDVTLTKGSKRSIIGIYAVLGEGNLYIDNLKITQNYKKGESLIDPFFMGHNLGWHDTTQPDDEDGSGYIEGGNEVYVTIPAWASGTKLYHQAQAIRGTANQEQNRYVFKKSKLSNLEFVRETIVGVGQVELDQNSVISVENGVVNVSNPEAQTVAVYTITGQQLYSGNGAEVSYTLPENGIYIVSCGKNTVKVIF